MGFSEKEIGHMSPKKYSKLYECYKRHYDFELLRIPYSKLEELANSVQENHYVSSDEWIPE